MLPDLVLLVIILLLAVFFSLSFSLDGLHVVYFGELHLIAGFLAFTCDEEMAEHKAQG